MATRLPERLAGLLHAARHAFFGPGGSVLYEASRSASFRLLYLLSGGRGRLVRVAGKFPLHVEWERIAIDFEQMEAGFTLPFGSAISDGMTVFDVGASIGEWSALAGSRAKAVRVHVFEPNGPSWTRIRRIFELNSLGVPAGIFRGFASEADKLTEDEIAGLRNPRWPDAFSGSARFEDLRHPRDIPSISLDSYCRITGAMPDVIKIDVEGAEGLVLRGAKETLQKHRPLVFASLHPWLSPAFGDTPEAIRGMLQELGYRWEILSIDHEEHWLALPANRPT